MSPGIANSRVFSLGWRRVFRARRLPCFKRESKSYLQDPNLSKENFSNTRDGVIDINHAHYWVCDSRYAKPFQLNCAIV